MLKKKYQLAVFGIAISLFLALLFCFLYRGGYLKNDPEDPTKTLDIASYENKLVLLANIPPEEANESSLWPVKTIHPKPGVILPFYRIVAYYGNFYSKNMGILGELPPDEMLTKLNEEVLNWQIADPSTPVMPAIDYIAITAQDNPGNDGKYRLRMPDSQIDKAIELAKKINGITILELQVGLSDLKTEIPNLEKYFKMPEVHLAIDSEFFMKGGEVPGTAMGTVDAEDINIAAEYLANLVREYDLPPKIVVIHRFTQDMLTNYDKIKILPEVQFVLDMDGFGPPYLKFSTYRHVIYKEPIQFTGFKLFYKNDLFPPSTRLITPVEILKLEPVPIFIQYQ